MKNDKFGLFFQSQRLEALEGWVEAWRVRGSEGRGAVWWWWWWWWWWSGGGLPLLLLLLLL